MKIHPDIKTEGADVVHSRKNNGFKQKCKYKRQANNLEMICLGMWAHVGKEGPEWYVEKIERLGLYVSTQFKNGSNMMECLKSKNGTLSQRQLLMHTGSSQDGKTNTAIEIIR